MPRSVDWQPSFNLGTDTGTAEEDVHRLFLSHSAVTPFNRSISPTDTGPGEHMRGSAGLTELPTPSTEFEGGKLEARQRYDLAACASPRSLFEARSSIT
jgi:hypothetical protein